MLKNKFLVLIIVSFTSFHVNLAFESFSDSSSEDDDQYLLWSELRTAIHEKDLDKARTLIANNPNLDISAEVSGLTLLFIAVNTRNAEMVELLLKNGANPNILTILPLNTPLHKAVDMQDKAMIALLLEHNANPNIKNCFGFTPLHQAVSKDPRNIATGEISLPIEFNENRDPEILKMLLEKNADPSILSDCVQVSWDLTQNEEVKKILFNYCDPSKIKSTNDAIEMYHAFRNNDKDKIQSLLRQGVDPNFTYGRNRETLLHLAVQIKNADLSDMVKMLLDNGADVNIQNNSAATPLFLVAGTNNLKTAEELLKRGAKLNIQDMTNGQTPLHKASRYGQFNMAKMFVDQGADLHVKDNYGNTPLHEAGNALIIRMLLDRGANPEVKNNIGQTPWDLQARLLRQSQSNGFFKFQNEYKKYKHTSEAQALRESGFDVTLENWLKTPLTEDEQEKILAGLDLQKVAHNIEILYRDGLVYDLKRKFCITFPKVSFDRFLKL